MNTTCPTTNDSTTMATKKQTITFTRSYTETKHYQLELKYDFEEFKETHFKADQLKHAERVWAKLLEDYGDDVELEDEEYEEEADADDLDDWAGLIQEPINDLVDKLVEEDRHQCDECGSYYPRSELKEDNTTFDKVAWWCKQCTSSWPK